MFKTIIWYYCAKWFASFTIISFFLLCIPLISQAQFSTLWSQVNNPGPGTDRPQAIACDASGIYIAGYEYISAGDDKWRVEKRDLITGALLWSQTSDPSSASDVAYAIAIDTSGVYVAGWDKSISAVNVQWRIEKRSLTTGALISAFGTGGVVQSNQVSGDEKALGITVNPSGIYIAGWQANGDWEWRIEKRDLTTGALVPAFGTGGKIISDPSTSTDAALAITSNSGGIYVAGYEFSSFDYKTRIEKRDLTTGALISAFGSGGALVNNICVGGDDRIMAITADATGLYTAGNDQVPGQDEWRMQKLDLTTGATIWSQASNPDQWAEWAYAITVTANAVYAAGWDDVPNEAQMRIEMRSKNTGALICYYTLNPSGSPDIFLALTSDTSGVYAAGYDMIPGGGNDEWRIEKYQGCEVLQVNLNGNDALCFGECNGFANVISTGGTPPYNYLWNTVPAQTNDTAFGLCAGNYLVTVTDAGYDTVTAGITINEPPQFTTSITGTDTICNGQNDILTAGAGNSYMWSNGGTSVSISVSPSVTSSYSVTVTDTNGCAATASFTITVKPAIIAAISGVTSVCNGSQTTLTASGGSSFYWSTGNTSQSVTVSPSTTTTYFVTVSDGSCIPDTDSITVYVQASPVITISPASTSICSGSADTLAASGASTFVWQPATGLNTTTGSTVIANPVSTTTYTVSGTTAGCTGTGSVTVNVNAPPVIAVNSPAICKGDSAALTATGANSYLWSNGDTSGNITVIPSTTTTYIVTGFVSGCAGSANATVTVNDIPEAQITGDTVICSGTQTSLTASGGSTYLWSTADTSQSIVVIPLSGTTYTVTVSTAACSLSSGITVNILPLPAADAGNDTTINAGGSAQLGGSGGISYLWSPATNLLCSNCQNATASPLVTTEYTLVVTDGNGCSASDAVMVFVDNECGEIFVPNAFSPNNDGYNDFECVFGNCIKTLDFAIYDRWGEKVFETSDKKICWDGNYRGKPMNNAVFVYRLKAIFYNGDEKELKGSISLIR